MELCITDLAVPWCSYDGQGLSSGGDGVVYDSSKFKLSDTPRKALPPMRRWNFPIIWKIVLCTFHPRVICTHQCASYILWRKTINTLSAILLVHVMSCTRETSFPILKEDSIHLGTWSIVILVYMCFSLPFEEQDDNKTNISREYSALIPNSQNIAPVPVTYLLLRLLHTSPRLV